MIEEQISKRMECERSGVLITYLYAHYKESIHHAIDPDLYHMGEFSHYLYAMIGCPFAMFNAFAFEQVQVEIPRRFVEQYSHKRS